MEQRTRWSRMTEWVQRWMRRGETNGAREEARVGRMASSARESAASQGRRPREGPRTLHRRRRSLSSLLFHPCRYIQICEDGSLHLFNGITPFRARGVCSYIVRRSQSRDGLRRQEAAAGETRVCVCVCFPPCACMFPHPCSAASYSQLRLGP